MNDLTPQPSPRLPTVLSEAPDAAHDPVDAYLRCLSAAIDALPREEVRQAVEMLLAAAQQRRRVYIIGNGGSAATASHMCCDLNKNATDNGKPIFRAVALTDNVPLLSAWANDAAYEDVFAQQLVNHVEPGDVVLGISTSGQSENVLRALALARDAGAKTIGFTGDKGGRMPGAVDCLVRVPCDHIGCQEDVHLALDHAITFAIQQRLGQA
jgi:D-sedoheptulose 7-phosphate isomerase